MHPAIRPIACMFLFAPLVAPAAPPAGQPDPGFGDKDPGRPGSALRGFDLAAPWNDWAFKLAQDASGRLFLAGRSVVQGASCIGLMRFTADGRQGMPHDPGFGSDDSGRICHTTLLGDQAKVMSPHDLVVLPGGDLLISGGASSPDYSKVYEFVCRFLPSGLPAPAFGPPQTPGCRLMTPPNTHRAHIAANHDSLFFVMFDGPTSALRVSRFDLDSGAPQPFGDQESVPILPPGLIDAPDASDHADPWDAEVTSDGDLVVVGYTIDANHKQQSFIARFDPALGKPAAGFGVGGVTQFSFGDGETVNEARAVDVQGDGSLLVTSHLRINDRNVIGIAKFNGDSGSPDPTFNAGEPLVYDPCPVDPLGCFVVPYAIDTTPSGHLVIGGYADADMFAARLRADGTPDPGFGEAGFARIQFGDSPSWSGVATGLVVQGEHIVLGGHAERISQIDGAQVAHQDFALVRLSDGRLFADSLESADP